MRVVILAPHTHAGADYKPGDTLDVEDHLVPWLVSVGAAKPEGGDAAPTKPRPKPDKKEKA